MASNTLSLRLPGDLLTELEAAAKARSLPPSTYAVRLIRDGLADGAEVADGPLVAAVRARCAEVEGAGMEVDRELALSLARLVEAGTASAVSAVRELRGLLSSILGDDDDWDSDLAIPE